LKFIGEIDELKLTDVKKALATVRAAPVTMQFSGTGFFPTPKQARVFWIGIASDEKLAALARTADESLHSPPGLEIEREPREFSPHLTLARGKPVRGKSARRKSAAREPSGSPQRLPEDWTNNKFQLLQEKLAKLSPPDFGTMTAHEFFLYQSKLSPAGSRYTQLERFALGVG
jgi:2'-5' RNA ligase